MIKINEKEYLDTQETLDYIISNTPNFNGIHYINMSLKFKRLHSKGYDSFACQDGIYYCDIDFIKESIELYKNSQSVSVIYKLLEDLMPDTNPNNFVRPVVRKLDAYHIYLFNDNALYINTNVCQEALVKIKELYNKNCIQKKELIELIHSTFPGLKESGISVDKYITKIIKQLNLEVIPASYKYNFFGVSNSSIYPEKVVQDILNYMKKNVNEYVTLVNLSEEEYLSLTTDNFKDNYKVLTLEDVHAIDWYPAEESYLNIVKEIKRTFKDTEIKVFKFKIGSTYVSIKELNEFKELMKDYVPATQHFKDLNLDIDFKSSIAKTNNIIFFKYKYINYIHKSEIERYINIVNYNKDLLEADNFYDTFVLKTKYFPHERESEFPNTKKMFLKFIKQSKRNKTGASHLFRVYHSVLDNIKVDLQPYNESKNNELLQAVLTGYSDNYKLTKYTIAFINYLKNKEKFKLLSASSLNNYTEKKPYKPEEFINLLSAMLSVLEDKDRIEKLYGDWQLSSAFTYVFLHFCLAWRRVDLTDNLPSVDLSMISNEVSDGESFINWLKDGNKLSYGQGRYICETLEEETTRLRKNVNKNDEFLHCIIADSLMWEVATLLCINEANKQIYFKYSSKASVTRDDRNFIYAYTNGSKLVSQFKKIDIDIEKILNGSFDNIRMNKGFMNLVRDKAEELNLFSYTYIELLRSHKAKPYQLSETTKIYLNKDVERGSVLAFSTGTMGSVLYLLKELVDNDFNTKALEEKIQDIKELNVTPYGLETSLNTISKKVTAMNKELEAYFKSNKSPEGFLEKFLYGQTFGGIEKQTKCLIKITRDEENNLRIAPEGCEGKTPVNRCPLKRRSCIGCDYMIALRYFIYEFRKKYDEIFTKLEKAKSKIDIENFQYIINALYIPLIDDLASVVGEEDIYKILDLDRLQRLT